MLHITYDSETTIRNSGESAVGNFSGSPFHPANHVVSYGEYCPDGVYRDKYESGAGGVRLAPSFLRRAGSGTPTLCVGHNVTFDLLYCAKQWPEEFERALPYLYIWDTQQAEYMLSGMTELYPSLDECCIKRGLPVKDDKIKAYWAAGIDTPMIPKDELLDYQKGDVMNTEVVYQDQLLQLADKPEMMELLLVKMDDLLFTMHMQLNGMQFDLQYAAEQVEALEKEAEKILPELLAIGQAQFPSHIVFDPGSANQVSLVLFGGELKNKEPVEVKDERGMPIRYKGGARAGQIKTRIENVTYRIDGLGISPEMVGTPKGKAGYYSTEADYVEQIDHPFAKLLSAYRTIIKDVETYYKGYAKLCWPDGRIHPSINHESTVTGRQSCTQPNLQNLTRGGE